MNKSLQTLALPLGYRAGNWGRNGGNQHPVLYENSIRMKTGGNLSLRFERGSDAREFFLSLVAIIRFDTSRVRDLEALQLIATIMTLRR